MKIFLKVLLSLLIIMLLTVVIIGIISWCNGLTIIEQLRIWFRVIAENPPAVDPNKKFSF